MGLTTILLVSVVLVAGVSNASATRLCDVSSCARYPANTSFSAKGTEPKLLSSIGTVACEKSSIAGETTAETGEPLSLKVTAVTFEGNCHLGGTSCTVTTTVLPTSPSLKATGEGDGTLSLEGAEVNFHCGFLLNCTYREIPALQFEGGNPASFGAEGLSLTKSKGLCPETSKLDATYTLTEPAPAYAVESAGQTRLCLCTATEEVTIEKFIEPVIYPANTSFSAKGTEPKLLSSIGTVACEKSSIAGETTAETGEPLSLKVTAVTFEGNCHLGGTSCTVTTTVLPTSPSLKATGEGDGTLSLEGAEVNFHCGFLLNCTYREIPALQFEGGNPASFGAEGLSLTKSKGLCPETSKLDATYTLTEPAPAYLAM